ncbi:hypothetical protein Bca4012_008332 [Brassica carinata]
MHRRLSSAEKGKTVALEHRPAPRVGRVRVSEPSNQVDTRRHALTLIGRVTNPSVQKVWSLIPFFTDHWKADISPVGSDLGMGMFQFQFEGESDMLTVLDKRPYHNARWMVILQRWEPTISPEFPSMIPFWIKIQGVPIHLWSEEISRNIGNDIGTFEVAEITAQTFRMRGHINVRLPLIKASVVEYPNGDELDATLDPPTHLDHKSSGGPRRHSPQRESRYKPYSRSLHSNSRELTSHSYRRGQYDDDRLGNNRYEREYYRSREERNYRHRKQPVHQVRDTFSGVSHTSAYQYGNERTRIPDRDGGREFPRSPRSLAAHSRESPHERDDSPLPLAALESARGEVREVMLQYTSCADPSESAARRERLRQAELQGQLEESAAQIVRASLARKDTGGSATIPGPSSSPTPTATMRIPAPKRLGPSASKSPDLTARVPIMDRLGPLLDEANSTDKDPTGSLTQKRKPGRPPGRRTTKASPIQGAGSKCRIANAKPPVCRRKITGEVGKPGTSKGRKNTKDSSSDGIPHEPEGSGVSASPEDTLSSAIRLAREWSISGKPEKIEGKKHRLIEVPVLSGTTRIQTDAAWCSARKIAGIGGIIHLPPRSREIQLKMEFIASPLMAEGLALREVMLRCQDLELHNLRFESDSSILVNCLNHAVSIAELHSVVADITELSRRFTFVDFVWIPRERNVEADMLAKRALNVAEPLVFGNAVISPN